jgi:hypothetical protein
MTQEVENKNKNKKLTLLAASKDNLTACMCASGFLLALE